MDLHSLQEQIISHPLFQKLKDVYENYPGYHDNEPVYDHLLNTAKIAQEQMDGHFITNPEAKEKFLQLVNQDIHETTLATIMILTALVHDTGKVLVYTENGEKKPLRIENPDGTTAMPGHPFWGGQVVVPEILQDIDLSTPAKHMIADVVKVHDAFDEFYLANKMRWPLDKIVSYIKTGATGYYEEVLFNQYVDCYSSPAFTEGKKIVEQVFNDSTFYNKRKYILP